MESVKKEPTMDELAALVLCKGELFYQTADGRTIKTVYPVTRESARIEAELLGVDWSEQ